MPIMMREDDYARVKAKHIELNNVLVGEDDLGVILRCAVLIETEMMDIISTMMPVKTHLHVIERFRFSQKRVLALSLGMQGTLDLPIKTIQDIRNDFAHSNIPSFTEKHVNDLYSSLTPASKFMLQSIYEEAILGRGDSSRPKRVRELPAKEQMTLMLSQVWNDVAVNAIFARETVDGHRPPASG